MAYSTESNWESGSVVVSLQHCKAVYVQELIVIFPICHRELSLAWGGSVTCSQAGSRNGSSGRTSVLSEMRVIMTSLTTHRSTGLLSYDRQQFKGSPDMKDGGALKKLRQMTHLLHSCAVQRS